MHYAIQKTDGTWWNGKFWDNVGERKVYEEKGDLPACISRFELFNADPGWCYVDHGAEDSETRLYAEVFEVPETLEEMKNYLEVMGAEAQIFDPSEDTENRHPYPFRWLRADFKDLSRREVAALTKHLSDRRWRGTSCVRTDDWKHDGGKRVVLNVDFTWMPEDKE